MLIRPPPARACLRVAATIALMCFTAGARADTQPWHEAAVTRIPPGADRVALSLGRDVPDGSLRIRVDGGSVFIRSVRITGEGARVTETPLRRVLGAGETADVSTGAKRVRDVAVLLAPADSDAVSLTLLVPSSATPVAAPPAQDAATPRREPAAALPRDVRMIAARAVNAGLASAPIPVGRDKGRFDWIGIQVAEGAAAIAEVRLTLSGGEVLRFGVGSTVTTGDVVALALPGDGGHSVSSIAVLPQPNGPPQGRAVVEVLARYATGWVGETGENRQMAAGWVLAGIARPAGRRSERQVIAVGDELGRYRRIRLVARNGDIDLREIVIAGSGGGRETRSVNQPLFRDQPLAAIDLDGARQVDTVTVSARARSAHAPDTVVEVWLQH